MAQDHLLWLLAETGPFDDHDLVFKGGTSAAAAGVGLRLQLYQNLPVDRVVDLVSGQGADGAAKRHHEIARSRHAGSRARPASPKVSTANARSR